MVSMFLYLADEYLMKTGLPRGNLQETPPLGAYHPNHGMCFSAHRVAPLQSISLAKPRVVEFNKKFLMTLYSFAWQREVYFADGLTVLQLKMKSVKGRSNLPKASSTPIFRWAILKVIKCRPHTNVAPCSEEAILSQHSLEDTPANELPPSWPRFVCAKSILSCQVLW